MIFLNPSSLPGSNGVIHLWDWRTNHKFQKIHRTKVYESQEVPICVFSAAFDKTGSKLIVSDASNIIKVYREAYTRVSYKFWLHLIAIISCWPLIFMFFTLIFRKFRPLILPEERDTVQGLRVSGILIGISLGIPKNNIFGFFEN